jgi:D-alanine--poly(phosphoribitol) ligase subunit 1
MRDELLNKLATNFNQYQNRTAFCIEQQWYTYQGLLEKVVGISQIIRELGVDAQSPVGIVTTNHLETYASIVALWFNRLVFVPLSPSNPKDRNANMMEQTALKYILSYDKKEAEEACDIGNKQLIETRSLRSTKALSLPSGAGPDDLLYILFTSGSTGVPKGVPITKSNLEAYIHAFLGIGYALNEEDRFLQIFDFTFDVSVQSYMIPLYLGASIYTVPQKGIRFLAALKILQQHQITFAKLVPSTLQFFKPYFNRIQLPHMRYSLFSGEGLPDSIVAEWAQCVPNAIIENHYGPTEATIDCLYHRWVGDEDPSYNGILAIGKLYEGMQALIMKEGQVVEEVGEKGELWVSGPQVTPGYWKNEEKNKAGFSIVGGKRYYKTGDIVFLNEQNIYLFCGRRDNQVQLQGYRVELGEVEHHIKQIIAAHIVVDVIEASGITSLVLFVEGHQDQRLKVDTLLRERLPHYMIPAKIIYLEQFPRTLSGKTDRKQLRKLL